jgi:hypothetical protein
MPNHLRVGPLIYHHHQKMPGRESASGHEERLALPKPSCRYGFGKRALARASGDENDAPKAAVHEALSRMPVI